MLKRSTQQERVWEASQSVEGFQKPQWAYSWLVGLHKSRFQRGQKKKKNSDAERDFWIRKHCLIEINKNWDNFYFFLTHKAVVREFEIMEEWLVNPESWQMWGKQTCPGDCTINQGWKVRRFSSLLDNPLTPFFLKQSLLGIATTCLFVCLFLIPLDS